MSDNALLSVQNLKMYFEIKKGLFGKEAQVLKAVDGVSFSIAHGETFGLVGESGCGKTTVGRTILKLYDPTDGKIIFKGEELENKDKQQMLPYRKSMQMIFQDPYSSLDPRMTVEEIINEPLAIHKLYSQRERNERVKELLRMVGLKQEHAGRYPHEFSGGQRQRIGIARALATDPEFIVCDEPISALDVSIQAQVINMLEDLQENYRLTYLFISHDLSMIRHISHHVGVMYLGNMVEYASTLELYTNMQHPYTKALMSAIPIVENAFKAGREEPVLQGEVPSPLDPPSGCVFRTRCAMASEVCSVEKPVLRDIGGGHLVACHLCS